MSYLREAARPTPRGVSRQIHCNPS